MRNLKGIVRINGNEESKKWKAGGKVMGKRRREEREEREG